MANQWNGRQEPWQGEEIPMSTRQTHHNPAYQDNSLPYEYDRPTTVNMVPTIDVEVRRGSDSSEEFDRHRRSSRRKWATTEDRRDIQEMIDALPSRQLEQLASDTAHKTSLRKRNSSKNFKRRGGSLHGTIRIARGHDPEEIIQTLARNEDYMDELDGDLRTAKAVRDMQLHMKEKRNIKKNASDIRRQKTLKRQTKQLGWFKRTKYSIGMSWMHLKQKMAEFAYSLELWKSHLKKIEGHFGTGVTSYFLFLKWIFLLNIPVCILTLGFVVIPQVLYRYYMKVPSGYAMPANSSVSFTGEELLTGGNWFEETEMYYGFYTNQTIQINNLGEYDMKFAYLFTCGGYYILTLIILALSISRSYKMNYIEGSGTQTFYMVSRVFCGWDYNITDTAAASLRHKSFFNEMKEFLSGKKKPEDDVKKLEEKCKWFFIRLLTNLLILGTIGGLAYMIYAVSGRIETNTRILADLALPLLVSAVILIVPPIFSLIARIESYEQPKNELYMNMLRTMLLKASILGILVYFWFTQTAKRENECWETLVGQEIYKLVIVDFIFTLGATFCLEFLRRIFATHCCKLKNPSPEFDIGRNTLDLIYSQALCWLGTYYSPLLSVIMILKLFIIFYVKRISVLQNCRPSLRPWRAARTHTIFMGFLFFFFLMATVAVAVGIIIIDSSHSCGPYRHDSLGDDQHYYAYRVVLDLIDSWRGEVVYEIISVITSPGSIALVLVALCVGTYYMRIVMIGHKEMVTLLRQQLAMEGRDKAYLLRMLQEASKKRKVKPSNINRTLAPQTSSLLNPGERSPEWNEGGHRFVRTVANSAAASGSYLESNTPRGRRRAEHNGMAGGGAPH